MMSANDSDEQREESDYKFAEVDAADDARIESIRKEWDRPPEVWPPRLPDLRDEADRRFTLKQMIVVMACASVLMLGFRLLPAGPFALVLGLLLLVSRIVLDTRGIENGLLHLAWWTLGLVYLIAIVVALLQG